MHTETSAWRYRPRSGEQGIQIDLLIDRGDRFINVCEMKFSINLYEINKAYAKELQTKMDVFQSETGTRKTLFLTLITTYGVKNNQSYPGLIQSEITMNDLFVE